MPACLRAHVHHYSAAAPAPCAGSRILFIAKLPFACYPEGASGSCTSGWNSLKSPPACLHVSSPVREQEQHFVNGPFTPWWTRKPHREHGGLLCRAAPGRSTRASRRLEAPRLPLRTEQPPLSTGWHGRLCQGCPWLGPGHRPHRSLQTWQQLNRRQWPLQGDLCFSFGSEQGAGSFPKAMLCVPIWSLCK